MLQDRTSKRLIPELYDSNSRIGSAKMIDGLHYSDYDSKKKMAQGLSGKVLNPIWELEKKNEKGISECLSDYIFNGYNWNKY